MTAPRFDPRRRRAVTIALLLVTALASFESTVVSTAMPTIIGDLGGLALYSWVFSIYLMTATVMMPIYGRLADIYGRRRILLIAIAVFLAGAIVCGFAHSMPQLIAARALQGLGAAGLVPIALTVSADLYSLEERARVQGLFSGVWGVASLIGPLLGAWMTISFGWRSIFTINIPLGLIALALVATQMVESRAALPDPLDLAGAATLVAGIAGLLFAVLHRPGEGGLAFGWRAAIFAAAVGSLALFVHLQNRRAHPLVPPSLFRRMETAAPFIAGVLLGTTIFGVDTFVPLFVQGARGGTAGAAGAVVTPLVLMWAVTATLAAKLIVRFGFRFTARLGASAVPRGPRRAGRRGVVERIRAVDLGRMRPRGHGPGTLVDVAGPRRPVRGARTPARRRDGARSLLPHTRRLGRRGRARRPPGHGTGAPAGTRGGERRPAPGRRQRRLRRSRPRSTRPCSVSRSNTRFCRCSAFSSPSPPSTSS